MKDKKEMLFQDENCRWYGPVEVENEEDIKKYVEKYRNTYYKYIIRETKDNTQSIIGSGMFEPDVKVRKRKL